MPLADLPHHVDIPARRDLELDAAVAFFQVAVDLVQDRDSIVVSIPRLTPERILARVAPSSEHSGFPARASTSQHAISSPARANRFPLTRR